MFNKDKCAGCRKTKYFVKYREVTIGHGVGRAKSLDKLCWSCGQKIRKFAKKDGH